MIFQVTIGGHALRVERAPDGTLLVDDSVRAVEVRELAADHWSVIVDGRSHEVVLLSRGPLRVQVDGVEARADLHDERELRAGPATGRARGSRHEVRAPMPGLLKRVHVREGDVVERDSALVTLEAMKMENELRAPQAGTVTRVAAAAGTKVEGGALLIVLGP